MNREERSIRIKNFDINYVEAGEGRPVILIHGLNIGLGQWHSNIEALSRHFKVYAIDLPGAGKSTRIDFTQADLGDAFVGVVAEFIKQKNLGRASLVGHSTGGWVAMKLAIESGELVDKLVLVNSLGFCDYIPWSYRPVAIRFLANLISKTAMYPTRDNIRRFLADVLYNKESLTDQLVDYYHEAVNAGTISHPLMLINRLFKPFKIREEFIPGENLKKISAPTLIIASDRDPLIPLRKQEANFSLISNSRVEIFKNTGHVPPIERSEEFNSLVINFLR